MQGANFTIIGVVEHLSDTKNTKDGKLMQPLTVKVTKRYDNKEKVAVLTIMTIDEVAHRASSLKTGDIVYVQGAITSRKYEDKDYMNLWASSVYRMVSGSESTPAESESDDDDTNLPF